MFKNNDARIAGAIGIGILGAVAAGGYLLTRSARSAHSDDAPGRTARVGSFGDYEVAGRSVTIAKPRSELFAFWRDFQNLPQFMENVTGIQPTGKDQAIWTIRGPAGSQYDVETRIAREEDGRLIAWRSVEGSEIDTEGRVEFHDAPGGRGTRVTLIVSYKPPAGKLGKTIAMLLRREPSIQARHDLKRFKMLIETGEIATSAKRRDQTRNARMEEA